MTRHLDVISRLTRTALPSAAACAVAALGAPTGALASALSGGAGLTATSPATTSAVSSAATVDLTGHAVPAMQPVSATGNGITIRTVASGLSGRRVVVTGTVAASDMGQVIEIERRGSGSARWLPTAHATVSRGGAFRVGWRATGSGVYGIDAVLAAPLETQAATRSIAPGVATEAPDLSDIHATSPAVTITVYALSKATLYGPTLWGNTTACGETLHHSTLGVANRTLPCGTEVTLYYDRRVLTVPVIDRGPYANGATWDLTMATAAALGIDQTSIIGADPMTIAHARRA